MSTLRTGLRPGDLGAIAHLHGTLYAGEHGLDATFEGSVAANLGAAALRGWPGDGEGLWVAEDNDGRLLGCIALTREDERRGQLRWFLLRPEARGLGLGRALLAAVVETADRHGYETVELVTFDALTAAAHLYRAAGFARTEATPQALWGRTLTIERYVRSTASRSSERSSGAGRSAKSRAEMRGTQVS